MKSKVPYLPVSPKEIITDVKRCHDLGVSMVHLHARDREGNPTWSPEVFAEIIQGIREIDRNLIIVVSTSGRNWSSLTKRAAPLFLKGGLKPDMGSLTLGSLNFPSQASTNPPAVIKNLNEIMLRNDIIPELEVFEAGMINYANYMIEKEMLRPPFYFNLIFGSLGSSSLNVTNIAAMLGQLPSNCSWAMGGIGRFQWAANSIAIALNGHVRVGLEDNPYYSWKQKSDATNPRLVERIVRSAKEFDRVPATSQQARAIIGLQDFTEAN